MSVQNGPIVVSASRRTDIPAFYMDWFMEQIGNWFFKVVNPYNGSISQIPAAPDDVHTIVFWSKNFGPFLRGRFGETLQGMGYHLFFNFTLNSSQPLLEPEMPPLGFRLDQMDELSRRFDPKTIQWRFDPICFFQTGEGMIQNNLGDFQVITNRAAQAGILRCITSFMDDYPKIRKRINELRLGGFTFIEVSFERKLAILLEMERELSDRGISLFTCCEKELLEALPVHPRITKSSCIPNELLMHLFGGELSLRRDPGQRTKQGCGCNISTDVGSYRLHPCFHNCLFCYANPAGSSSLNQSLPTRRLIS